MNRRIISAMAALSFCFSGAGQELDFPAEERTDTASTDFNALKYSLQKHFRPTDKPFCGTRLRDNIVLRLGAGSSQTLTYGSGSYSWGWNINAGIGKRLNKYNILGAEANVGGFRRNEDGSAVNRADISLVHNFDITSYIAGYDPSGHFSISTFESAGLGISHTGKDGKGLYCTASFGFELRLQVLKGTEIYCRPFAGVCSDGYERVNNRHWSRLSLKYGAELGAMFNINRANPEYKRLKDSGLTIFAGAGAGFLASDLVTETCGLLRAAREQAGLGIGHEIKGPLSARYTAFYGRSAWKRLAGSIYKYTWYFGLRPELVFDPMRYSRDPGIFSLGISIGPEMGIMLKNDVYYSIRRAYMGITTAVRCGFRLSGKSGIFIEPRMSIVPYNYLRTISNGLEKDRQNYYDTLFSLTLGYSFSL